MSINLIRIIKISVVYLLAITSTYLLLFQIDLFLNTQDYFSLSITPIFIIGSLFLFVLYSVSLTVGHWQSVYSTIALPVLQTLIFVLFFKNSFPTLNILLILLCLLLVIMGAVRSYYSKSNLIKFDPAFVLRPLNKALLLIFSLYAGFSVYSKPELIASLNIGEKISQTIQGPTEEMIKTQLNNAVKNQINNLSLEGFSMEGSDLEKYLKEAGVEYFIDKQESSRPIIDVKQVVQTQVNNFLEPYKSYIPLGLSIIIFFLVNFYLLIAYYVYVVTIGTFIVLAKKLGILRTESKTIEQETLVF